MALGIAGLNIVRARSTPHLDSVCDDWLPFDVAMRARAATGSLPPWDWDPFPWHVIIPSANLETAAAVDPGAQSPLGLEGLIAVEPHARKLAAAVLAHEDSALGDARELAGGWFCVSTLLATSRGARTARHASSSPLLPDERARLGPSRLSAKHEPRTGEMFPPELLMS